LSRSARATRYLLRFDDEASTCPACASPRIVLVDECGIPRDGRRRRVRLISGCRDCGLLFSNPQPRPEQLAAFYSEGGEWAARHAERRRWLEARTRRNLSGKKRLKGRGKRDVLFDAIAPYAPVHAPPSGASALDFGCGDGKMLDWLQGRGWETYGIEPSMDVAFIRHRRLSSPPQDQRFGLIIVNHVLEHTGDPLGVLHQIAGALRDDGTLFVSVPGVDALPEHGDFRYCVNGTNHPLCFSETCLRGLLARASLAVTARLNSQELDDAFTQGRPLRLRLLAARAAVPPGLPDRPLNPAIRALALHAQRQGGLRERVRRLLPVRLRAALTASSRERKTAPA
jgi:SAM-dependent methyltransferase